MESVTISLGPRITLRSCSTADVVNMNNKLRDGDSSVWLYHHGGNSSDVNALYLADGDEEIIAEKIKLLLK